MYDNVSLSIYKLIICESPPPMRSVC